MKKWNKLISMLLLVTFLFATNSIAFANENSFNMESESSTLIATEVMADYDVLTDGALGNSSGEQTQKIDEIFVKDQAILEMLEEDITDVEIVLVDEFPVEVEAQFQNIVENNGEEVLNEDIQPKIPVALPLAGWLGELAYAGLLSLGIINALQFSEFADANAVEMEAQQSSYKYFQAAVIGNKVCVGTALDFEGAKKVLQTSMKLGPDSTASGSCKNTGNIFATNMSNAKYLADYVTGIPYNGAELDEVHGSGANYFYHYHPLTSKWAGRHTAHVWFYH